MVHRVKNKTLIPHIMHPNTYFTIHLAKAWLHDITFVSTSLLNITKMVTNLISKRKYLLPVVTEVLTLRSCWVQAIWQERLRSRDSSWRLERYHKLVHSKTDWAKMRKKSQILVPPKISNCNNYHKINQTLVRSWSLIQRQWPFYKFLMFSKKC